MRADIERPVPLCVRFLRACPRGSPFHRTRGRRTPEGGTGAQYATLRPLQRARCPAIGSCTAGLIDLVFPRRRLTYLCRKPRASSLVAAYVRSTPRVWAKQQ